MGAQPAPILPRMSTGPMNLQPPTKIPSSQMLSNVQLQQLPFVDALPASTKNYSADNTNSPSTRETRSKSSNRQGIKQSSSASSSASTSTGKTGPICWNCGEVGHRSANNCKLVMQTAGNWFSPLAMQDAFCLVCWFSCSFVSEACACFGEWL